MLRTPASLALSARLRLLLVNLFYKPCNVVQIMKHTKTLNNNFLQIVDIDKN